jgi:hypothetical protein
MPPNMTTMELMKIISDGELEGAKGQDPEQQSRNGLDKIL